MRQVDDWPRLRDMLRDVVDRRGVDLVADEIPADRSTVFRLLGGATRCPSLAIRAGVERIVGESLEDRLASQVRPDRG